MGHKPGLNNFIRKDNVTGVPGVYCLKARKYQKKPWRAAIYKNSKAHHLGCFATFEEAVVARKQAESKWETM